MARDAQRPAARTQEGLGSAPRLIVLSGPAGAGKSTVGERLCRGGGIRRGITATTRPPRPGEVDGRDYFFLSQQEFRRRMDRGEFLEHATVHGHLYGTPRRQVDEALGAGESCLLLLDVQGATAVRAQRPDAVLIFLDAPDQGTLSQRLAARSTEGATERRRRMAAAAAERRYKDRYDYCVINDDLDRAVGEIRAILAAGGCDSGSRRRRLNG